MYSMFDLHHRSTRISASGVLPFPIIVECEGLFNWGGQCVTNKIKQLFTNLVMQR